MHQTKGNNKSDFLGNSFLFFEYVSAVEGLIHVANKRESRDVPNSVYPTAYLFRHALELGIKTIISLHGNRWEHGHFLVRLKEKFENLINTKHEEEIVWGFTPSQLEKVNQTFDEIKEKFPEIDEKKIEDMRNFSLTPFLQLLKKYHDFDPNGETFRYPESELSYDKKVEIFESISGDIEILSAFKAFLGLYISATMKETTSARDTIKQKSENS